MKNKMKNIVKRITIICIVAVISLNLVACKQKTNNIAANNQTKIDVNSPEVQATLGAIRNYEAEKLLPSGTAEREKQVWTKRNHKWAEPPEEDKIYVEGKGTSWLTPYVYNGKEYWVGGANKGDGVRAIFKKTSDNYIDDKKNQVMAISPDVNDSIYNLISELEVGRDVSKNIRGNADTITITR